MVRRVATFISIVLLIAVITLKGRGQSVTDPEFQSLVTLFSKVNCNDPSSMPMGTIGFKLTSFARRPGWLLKKDKEFKATILHWAAASGNPCVIKSVLETAAPFQPDLKLAINTRNVDNYTPLHQAVLVKPEADAVVSELLKVRDIQVNAHGAERAMPLHFAARNRHSKIVELLLGKMSKEDVNAMTELGFTPLHEICSSKPVNPILTTQSQTSQQKNPVDEIVRMLLEKGAELRPTAIITTPRVTGGLTPLHLAVQSENYLAIYAIVSYLGRQRKEAVDVRNFDGDTPLHLAAKRSLSGAIQPLVVHGGANVELTDGSGNLPLHLYLNRKITNNTEFELLKKGVNINFKGQDGNTPLHLAAKSRNIGMMSEILKSGGDPNATNDDGKKPQQMINDPKTLATFQGMIMARSPSK